MTVPPSARRAALALIAGLTLTPAAGLGQDAGSVAAPGDRLGLALYQDGRAIVTDRRLVDMPAGPGTVVFHDLLPGIDPLTASASLSGAGTVARVTVATETISAQALAARLVGEDVLFARALPGGAAERIETARLIAAAPDLILDFGGQVEADPPGRLLFDRLPDDLAAAPFARVAVEAEAPGPLAASLIYQTGGIDWRAEYDLRLDGRTGRLAGWAVLRNGTGRAIAADVVLVAGDVNRQGDGPRPVAMRAETVLADAGPAAPAPMAADGRYLYRLEDPVALPAGGVAREALLPAADIAVERVYRLDGSPGPASRGPALGTEVLRPALIARIANSADNNLGQALPAGIVRLIQPAEAGPAAVLGEDRIAHTADGQTLELALGRAFDIAGERETTGFRRLDDRGAFEAETRIRLTNPTATPVTVELREGFPPQSQILSESQPRAESAAGLALWRLDVPAEGAATLTYAIRVQP